MSSTFCALVFVAKWNPGSVSFARKLNEAGKSGQLGDVKLFVVDIDDSDAARELGVSVLAAPTLAIFNHGKPLNVTRPGLAVSNSSTCFVSHVARKLNCAQLVE